MEAGTGASGTNPKTNNGFLKFLKGPEWSDEEAALLVSMVEGRSGWEQIYVAINERFHGSREVRSVDSCQAKFKRIQKMRKKMERRMASIKMPVARGGNGHARRVNRVGVPNVLWTDNEVELLMYLSDAGVDGKGMAKAVNNKFHGGMPVRTAPGCLTKANAVRTEKSDAYPESDVWSREEDAVLVSSSAWFRAKLGSASWDRTTVNVSRAFRFSGREEKTRPACEQRWAKIKDRANEAMERAGLAGRDIVADHHEILRLCSEDRHASKKEGGNGRVQGFIDDVLACAKDIPTVRVYAIQLDDDVARFFESRGAAEGEAPESFIRRCLTAMVARNIKGSARMSN